MSADDLFLMGYYGDASRFMVNVMPGRATVLLTHIDAKGEAPGASGKQATDAVAVLRDLLDCLTKATQADSSEASNTQPTIVGQ